MFKITLEAKAKTAIHSGSDSKNSGNVKLQRREPFIVQPKAYSTRFKSDSGRRKAIADILFCLFSIIPKEYKKERLATINEEFFSAIEMCCTQRDRAAFLEKFCSRFGIRGAMDVNLIDLFDRFDDDREFLDCLRVEKQYIFLLFRSLREKYKDDENKATPTLFDERKDYLADDIPSTVFAKDTELIPIVSANSIRHQLRNLAMQHFFEYIGKTDFKKAHYYEYFSGGALTGESGKIDLKNRKNEVLMCPPLGIFGTAKGNEMIGGSLKIGHLIPKCSELGTGHKSHYELTMFDFGTRTDIAKDEKRFDVIAPTAEKKENPQQMIYSTECIMAGTEMEITIALEPTFEDMRLLASCLVHTLELFEKFPFVGGKSAVAHGELLFNLPYDQLEGMDSQYYLDYLETQKDEMVKYFENV
jgi:hypothetical protein